MPSTEKFKDSLAKFEVDEKIITLINSNDEKMLDKDIKKMRSDYFKNAIDIMDEYMDHTKKQEILEWNACCKGGTREKASKLFAKENMDLTIEEKLDKIKNVPHMGTPILNNDGSITLHAVYYKDNDKFECACSTFNKVKRDYVVSKSYCYCCGGHFKYHYEIMLGVKLQIKEIVSSPLDSDGTKPCVLLLEIIS